jgi:ribonuclease-3
MTCDTSPAFAALFAFFSLRLSFLSTSPGQKRLFSTMDSLESKITTCETIVSYDFGNKLLCAMALSTFQTMGAVQGAFRMLPRNDRIAVYGDAVASSYLCRKWFDTGLQKGGSCTAICDYIMLIFTGHWDTIRQAALGNSNLATVGFAHELHCCVILNPGTATVSDKTMATTVEAILGAVHIDGGDAALAQVMESLGLTHTLLEEVTYYLTHTIYSIVQITWPLSRSRHYRA